MKIYKYNGKCNASGERIRVKREQMEFSQEQLAAQLQLQGLNLSQKTISRIETGDRIVADFELIVFSSILQTTADELLGVEKKR